MKHASGAILNDFTSVDLLNCEIPPAAVRCAHVVIFATTYTIYKLTALQGTSRLAKTLTPTTLANTGL